MAHSAREALSAAHPALLVCRQCMRIIGCDFPTPRSCDKCTAHNCPTLPAPHEPAGICTRCAVTSRPRPRENTFLTVY